MSSISISYRYDTNIIKKTRCKSPGQKLRRCGTINPWHCGGGKGSQCSCSWFGLQLAHLNTAAPVNDIKIDQSSYQWYGAAVFASATKSPQPNEKSKVISESRLLVSSTLAPAEVLSFSEAYCPWSIFPSFGMVKLPRRTTSTVVVVAAVVAASGVGDGWPSLVLGSLGLGRTDGTGGVGWTTCTDPTLLLLVASRAVVKLVAEAVNGKNNTNEKRPVDDLRSKRAAITCENNVFTTLRIQRYLEGWK